MYNKHNLAVASIASESSIKPEFGCVAFYGNRTVATDSFRLIEVSAKGEAHPVKLMNAKIVKTKKLKKDEECTFEGIGGVAVEATYPEIDKCFETLVVDESEYVTVTINGHYLAEIAKLAASLDKFDRIKLSVPKEERRAVRITAERKLNDGAGFPVLQSARALLMPIVK